MRTHTCLGAMSALLLSATAAFAATGPSGKYAFISSEMCEAKLTVSKDNNGKVISVGLTQPGLMSGGVGYITFTPKSASGGNAAVTGSTLIEGGALRVGAFAFNWAQKANNKPATPYSFTATTFTFGGMVYRYVGSNLAGGFFRNVYLARRDTAGGNTNCVNVISATKQ